MRLPLETGARAGWVMGDAQSGLVNLGSPLSRVTPDVRHYPSTLVRTCGLEVDCDGCSGAPCPILVEELAGMGLRAPVEAGPRCSCGCFYTEHALAVAMDWEWEAGRCLSCPCEGFELEQTEGGALAAQGGLQTRHGRVRHPDPSHTHQRRKHRRAGAGRGARERPPAVGTSR